MKNLYFDTSQKDVVAELKQELLDWLVATTRPATVHCANSGEKQGDPQYFNRYECFVNADGKVHPDLVREAGHRNYL